MVEHQHLIVSNGDIDIAVDLATSGTDLATSNEIASRGTVVCVAGWPELGRSWRHQQRHLVERGYRVATVDVRGYGASSAPPEVERYTLRELSGDIAAVAEAVSDDPVVVLCHDWGAPIGYHTAIRHPDSVAAVIGLSVPHMAPNGSSPIEMLDLLYADRFFYMLYFARPGVAEADFGRDLRGSLKRCYWALSGEAPAGAWTPDAPRDASLLDLLPPCPDGPLSFLPDDELDALVSAFERTGMTGAFNRYRASALDAAADLDIVGARVEQPSCFIAGALDPVRNMVPGVDLYAEAGADCSEFRGTTLIPGAGHWVHQEAIAATNAAIDAFVDSL